MFNISVNHNLTMKKLITMFSSTAERIEALIEQKKYRILSEQKMYFRR